MLRVVCGLSAGEPRAHRIFIDALSASMLTSAHGAAVKHLDIAEAWPSPALRDFDAAMRCAICGELFSLPASLRRCGHCFCSDCARRTLPVTEKCPHCREPAREVDLVANKALEQVVEAFKSVREELLDAVTRTRRAPGGGAEERRNMPSTSSRRHVQPVIERVDEYADDEDPTTAEQEDSDSGPIILDDDGGPAVATDARTAPCPVCNAGIQIGLMNSHLNVCLVRQEVLSSPGGPGGESRQKKQRVDGDSGSGPSAEVKKLPKLAYHVFGVAKLREMCKSVGLAANGDKKQLEARHKEFTTRVNSIIDYGRVPDQSAIAREVNREEARRVGAGAKARMFGFSAQTKEKEAENSNAIFAKLIEEVRNRSKRKDEDATTVIRNEDEYDVNEDAGEVSEDEILPLSQAAPRYVPTDDDVDDDR